MLQAVERMETCLTLKEPGGEESARINFDSLALRVEQSWGCQT